MPAFTQANYHEGANPQQYSAVAKLLHWLIVLLLLMQFSTEWPLPSLLGKSADDALAAWHVSIGPTILLIMLLRLAWRLTHRPPSAPRDLPPPLRVLSRATHWLLYAVLIVLPVLGWLSASAFGATPMLLGFIPLPALIGQDKPTAEAIGAVHGSLALVLLALIALHVAGATYHVIVKRDRVLSRILP